MAKLTKEELIQKVDSLPLSDDEKISFMEDITDSFEIDNSELESIKSELESAKADLEKANSDVEDIKAKYKARFLSGEVKVEDEEKEEVIEEPKEEEESEVIDVKDIFADEEKKEDEE